MATLDYANTQKAIHLTITESYARSWDTWEGVREFIQNWYDGVLDSFETVSPAPTSSRRTLKIEPVLPNDYTQFEAKLVQGSEAENEKITFGSLRYDKDKKTLTLINRNTQLPTKVLLLGYSSKRGHHDVIGQFGEGLKIGTLALLRKKHKVRVATHNCSWHFSLEKHPHFDETVLTVTLEDIQEDFQTFSTPFSERLSGDSCSGDTCSQIWPIEEKDWDKWVKRFLFLCPSNDSVETELGSLLLDSHLQGHLYVKQVWLSDRKEDGLSVGVNFKELEIDRDRCTVVHQSEIDHNVSCMWSKGLKRRPDLARRYYQMLEKGDHTADTRLATYYIDDMQVSGMIADEFHRQYGENAVPIPNSSTADKLSYLHKELQEKVVLCNQTLIEILHRSGKVRRYNEITGESAPAPPMGRIILKSVPPEQLHVLQEAEQFVKIVEPQFNTAHIMLYEGRDSTVSYVSPTQLEVPNWMLNADHIHQQIACPAESPDNCHCASAFLCERLLTAMGPRKNDPGDKKLQQLLMTFALMTRGKKPKQIPVLSSYEDILKRDDQERDKTISTLQESLRDEQRKHQAELEEMRKKLNAFQSDLAKEDIRFTERQSKLIEQQKQEKDGIRQKYEEMLKQKKREYEELQEDYSNITGELQSEKRKKTEVETELLAEKDKHKNELTQSQQESSWYLKRCGEWVEQITSVRTTAKSEKKVEKHFKPLAEFIEKNSKSGNCIVCLTSNIDCVFRPCGMALTCMKCSQYLKNCPQCYKPIQDRLLKQ